MSDRPTARAIVRIAAVCCLAVLLAMAIAPATAHAYWYWSSTTRMTITVAQEDDPPAGVRTVTFDSRGGSPVAAVTVDYGSAVATPTAPTRPGHTFAGWYTGTCPAVSWTFSTPITSDITLCAKWVENHTIYFHSNGGSAVADINQAIGSVITAPADPTKPGYAFAGWYKTSRLKRLYVFMTMPDRDLTLYAKWVVGTFTVTFDANGGTCSPGSVAIAGGCALGTRVPNPTRVGFVFCGWYTAADGSGTAFGGSTPVTGNLTVYARWVLKTCTVTFRLADDKDPDAVWCSRIADYCSTVATPSAPTRSGYIFAGWYTDACPATLWEFSTVVTEDLALYARWVENHTISFKSEGGSPVAAVTQAYGSIVATPVAPIKSGHVFVGWYMTGCWKTPYEFTTMPDSNITLHAKWINDRTGHEQDPKESGPKKPDGESKRLPIADARPSEETSRTVPCASDEGEPAAPAQPSAPSGSSNGDAARKPSDDADESKAADNGDVPTP